MEENEIPAFYIGINLPAKGGVSNSEVVDTALDQGYDFVTSRLTSRAYRKRVQELYQGHDHSSLSTDSSARNGQILRVPLSSVPCADPPASAADIAIHPGPHVSNTVGLAAPWIELDAKDDTLATVSEQVLSHELQHASYCGLPYVIVEGPRRRTYVGRYAHSLRKLLARHPDMNIILHTTFTEEFRDGKPPGELLSTWEVWDAVRSLCGYPANLGVALELGPHPIPDRVIRRWLSEPVALLILSGNSCFVPNSKNYPVLPRHTQQILAQCSQFRIRPFLLVKDTEDSEPLVYLRYLCSKINSGANQYADLLQKPLQPLTENLRSTVYETFEADKPKYELYSQAIAAALAELSWVGTLVIMIAGAGQGPLVSQTLNCLDGRDTVVYAIEKNSGAAAYLSSTITDPRVNVVCADVRSWTPPHRAHLIISELLGSWGDNELSPECLEPFVQTALEPSGKVIPQSYTAYAAPIQCPIQWAMARKADGLERPWVVDFHQADMLADPQPLWQFMHPSPSSSTVRTRYAKACFELPHNERCRVYGFVGYFESELYGGITVSTLPSRHTPHMHSWFPLWLPLSTPLDCPRGAEVDFSVWRDANNDAVWYEWSAETFTKTREAYRARLGASNIHNTDASHFCMKLK